MAHVFVVEHVRLGMYFAAKIARPDQPSAAACEVETELVARADHLNVVKLIDYDLDLDCDAPLLTHSRWLSHPLINAPRVCPVDVAVEPRHPRTPRTSMGVPLQLS